LEILCFLADGGSAITPELLDFREPEHLRRMFAGMERDFQSLLVRSPATSRGRHRPLIAPGPCGCRLAPSLHGGAKSQLVDSLDDLISGHARGIERHPRLLVAEGHVRSLHPREPFQGSLDRNRSGPSGHTFN